MRQVHPGLWIGHAGDVRDLRGLRQQEIEALIDLALADPPLAITTVASLVRTGTPTLVFCGAGMSRSASVAAGALALVTSKPAETCLRIVTSNGPADVSRALWQQFVMAVQTLLV